MNEHNSRLNSLLISCLCIILCIVPAAAEDVIVERTLSAVDVAQGNSLDVTLSIEGIRAGGIVETIPDGFEFAGTDHPADRYSTSGSKVLFSVIGENEIAYRVQARAVGTWTFSGVWDDVVSMANGTVPESQVTVSQPHWGDSGGDGGSSSGSATTTTAATPVAGTGESRVVRIEEQEITEMVVSGTALPDDLSASCHQIDLPATVPTAPGEVYSYYNITIPAVNGSIEGVVIRFSLPVNWVENQTFSAAGVSLYRYVDGWTSLNTTLTGTVNGSYTFEAESPGCSIFAISGKEPDKAAATLIPTTQPTPVATPKVQDTLAASAAAEDNDPGETSVLPLLGGLAVVVIVLGAGIWYLHRGRDAGKEE